MKHDWLVGSDHRCQGTTKKKEQCRNIVTRRFSPFCGLHQSEASLQMTELLTTAYKLGREEATASASSFNDWKLKLQEDEVARLKEQIRNLTYRERDEHGRQIVVVNIARGLTYAWGGSEPLSVGDVVVVPGNWLHSSPQTAEVIGIGSDYKGSMSSILRKVS